MATAHEILAVAEKALVQAEAVRLAAIKAVELAQEAVKLEAAGVAAELLIVAADVAAKAVKAAEVAALEAWEMAATRALERSIEAGKGKSGGGGLIARLSRACSVRSMALPLRTPINIINGVVQNVNDAGRNLIRFYDSKA